MGRLLRVGGRISFLIQELPTHAWRDSDRLPALRRPSCRSMDGNTDVAGRLIGTALGAALGQQIVVENKPGAGGAIAAGIAAKAQPDGYTLLLASSALTITPAIYDNVPYDIGKDFVPVGLAAVTSLVLAASPQSGLCSVADLVKEARANPGKLTFGWAGIGSGSHLAGQLFNQTLQIRTLHVPYKGSGPATTAVVAGEVTMTFTSQAGALPFHKGREACGPCGHGKDIQQFVPRRADHRVCGRQRLRSRGLDRHSCSRWYAKDSHRPTERRADQMAEFARFQGPPGASGIRSQVVNLGAVRNLDSFGTGQVEAGRAGGERQSRVIDYPGCRFFSWTEFGTPVAQTNAS